MDIPQTATEARDLLCQVSDTFCKSQISCSVQNGAKRDQEPYFNDTYVQWPVQISKSGANGLYGHFQSDGVYLLF